MNRTILLGTGLVSVGITGYIAGIYATYPGRAFSVTAVMIGFTLIGIARQSSQ